MTDAVLALSQALKDARSVVALTGARISAESGIPTFRGANGLWKNYAPEKLATPEAFGSEDWARALPFEAANCILSASRESKTEIPNTMLQAPNSKTQVLGSLAVP